MCGAFVVNEWPGQACTDRVAPAKAIMLHNGKTVRRASTQTVPQYSTASPRPLFLLFGGLHLVISLYSVPTRGHELLQPHLYLTLVTPCLSLDIVPNVVVAPAYALLVGACG
jgi:hypothetical protein